jgi:uncharacterized protein YcsI (UPF0317 family)
MPRSSNLETPVPRRHPGGMRLPHFPLESPLAGARVRAAIRSKLVSGPTRALAPGHVQANLVVLPARYASDYIVFCLRNPRALPILDITSAGSFAPLNLAPRADLRTDLPLYNVYRRGQVVDQVSDATAAWPRDGVAVLTGCSFSFEHDLEARGLWTPAAAAAAAAGAEPQRNVAMYETTLDNAPSGPFAGKLVVSMRWIGAANVDAVARVTADPKHETSHGAPLLHLRPWQIRGDLSSPKWGSPSAPPPGGPHVPVFWACGVTAQSALEHAGALVDECVTHAPGCMFISDKCVQ